MKALLVGALLAIASLSALAQPAALIEGVQTPAWRERDGKRMPLVPGMELRAGDRIISGKDARVVLKLSEGSVVKLGENGSLRLAEVNASKELFRAALQVLEGAFRFTTDVAARARKREVDLRLEQVTIGIRGTDVWGRARADRQIVCLFEGMVEIEASGEPPVALDQPRQFYRREQGQAQPVGFVEPQQLHQWSEETEIGAGKGALRRGGRFAVALFSAEELREAIRRRDELREAGYPAETLTRKDGDKASYTVRIRHLPTREEAQMLADQLAGKFGIKEPAVTQ
jgi:hypothetical protein